MSDHSHNNDDPTHRHEGCGQEPAATVKPADPRGTDDFTAELVAHFHQAKRNALTSSSGKPRPVKGR